ncbi:MAG: hypothetical protein HKN12_01085, partial [Gemmatimonadetes bacterium]|nr:hypothetical protein [Gemmatimonadota bacterium]
MRLAGNGTVIALAALLLAACSTDGDGPMEPQDEGPAEIDGVVVENTTPQDALTSFAAAHIAKSVAAYRELICEDFQYFIQPADLNYFPWLQSDSWDRITDLSLTANLFDPNFSGTTSPVETCGFLFNILNQRDLLDDDGVFLAVEVTVDATITALTGPNDGFLTDT